MKSQVRKRQRKQRRVERRENIRAAFNQDEGLRSSATTIDPPSLVDSDLMFRAASMGEPNEAERTVVATLTTEQPVPMYDTRTGKGVIDEILVARGGKFPEQLVMLDDHNRFSGSRSVIGSIRSLVLSGDRWRGTLHFATDAGDTADEVWQLVRQKHLTDVSLGYRYGNDDFVDIQPGRSLVVEGRTYTAGSRILRVVKNWSAREGSTTPIGADDQAKIGRAAESLSGIPNAKQTNLISDTGVLSHSEQGRNEDKMNIFQWLQARGMSAEITDQAAALKWAQRNLAGDLLSEFTTVCRSFEIEFNVQSTAAGKPATQQPVAVASTLVVDPYEEASRRATYINQMADGVPVDVVRKATTEKWDVDTINKEFLAAKETSDEGKRSDPLTPAIHVKQSGMNLRTLQATMLLRSGVEINDPMLRSKEAAHVLSDKRIFSNRNDASWMSNYSRNLAAGGATQDDEAARAVDNAYQFRSMSMVDFCRGALDAEGVTYSAYDRDEIVQRSFSTATLNAVFTTNFAAQMLEGFMDAPDTTAPWTREADLPNFQTVERFQMSKFSKLKKTDRNQTPDDADVEAVLESYKLARYSERFTVDEMDIIDDRFGALDETPRDLGEAARVLRPDLVYSILLGNPDMGQDSTALFHTDHGNLTASGAALSSATLAARKSAMASQTSNGRLLNIRGQYLIVPETKDHVASVLVGSSERRDTTSSTEYGTMNWANGRFSVISEPRLDVGVIDPSSGATNAGQAGAWFLATANGKHGIEVGHLRGSGRAPVVRRYELTEGRIGMGWLVVMYVAAKATGYQGLAKSAS